MKKTPEKGIIREMTYKNSLSKTKSSMHSSQAPLIDFTECNRVLTKEMTLSLALKMKLFEVLENQGRS
jgi:hypothetical protein